MTDKPTKIQNRAAALAIMLELDRLGYLEGMSDIKLAKLLHVDRTTVWRYRQDLPNVREAVAAICDRLDEEEEELSQAIERLQAELAAAEARRDAIVKRKAQAKGK